MEENKSIEQYAFELIAYAGDARSSAFNALYAAKKGKFDEAKLLLEKCKESTIMAHKIQTEILTSEAGGSKFDINVLFVHAQDHLMTSMLAKELIEDMIDIRKELDKLKNK
ncbi:PTS lactose/cellobiose transporter subunit IIA [Clostridium sp.]|uniref:PTS lactose/cellobiose transporter subunit IIA n=1 Tax=Clostridium sp. TaxID=1506 RepID=UPI002603EBD7